MKYQKLFRIVYWHNAGMCTERYIRAYSEPEAREYFTQRYHKDIISVEEVHE